MALIWLDLQDIASSALVDSAPGHQETPKPLVGLFSIKAWQVRKPLVSDVPHLEVSFKRTNQVDIPASVNVV
jgi:hypothetical protein